MVLKMINIFKKNTKCQILKAPKDSLEGPAVTGHALRGAAQWRLRGQPLRKASAPVPQPSFSHLKMRCCLCFLRKRED